MTEESPIKRLFVLHNGKETGPWQFREVMDQLRAGSLALDDPGWLEGSAERAPLRSILPKLGPPLPLANARPAAAQRPPAMVVSGPGIRSPPKPTDSATTHKRALAATDQQKKAVSIAGKAPIVPRDSIPKPALDAGTATVGYPLLRPISGDLQSDPNATLDAPKPLSVADDEMPSSSVQNVTASTDELADSLHEKVVIRAPDSPSVALSRPKATTGAWGWIIAALLLDVLLLVIVLRPRQPTAEQTPPQPAPAPSISVAPTPEVSSTQRSQPDETSTKNYAPPAESPGGIYAPSSPGSTTTTMRWEGIYGVKGRVVQRWERLISIARIGGECATSDDPIQIARDASTAVYGEPGSNDLVNINYKMYMPSAAKFSAKTYSLTGRIVDLQPQVLTIETNGVRWDVIRELRTTVGEDFKFGSEITLSFKMLATAIFLQPKESNSSGPDVRVAPQSRENAEAAGSRLAASPSGAMLGERFPQTRTRIVTATELQSWSANDLQYAINEMYARQGADFQDAVTKNTFAKFPWYHPRARFPLSEIEHSFGVVEAANVKLLGDYRDARNERERFPLETTTRSLTPEEVRNWSDEKLRYAINEVYARHGAEIENPMVRKQFSGLDWYRPVPGKTYKAAETEFSAVERYNVHLLGEYRKTLARAPQPTNQSRSGIITYPYSGTVKAVNVQAATIKVQNSRGSYIVVITPDTQLSKNGNAVALRKVAIGDNVRGQARITPDGRGVAASVIIKSSPSLAPPRSVANSPAQYPTAKVVPGKPGYVFSPFDPRGGYVDVNGFTSGSKVKDPYSGKIFLVP
jgi:hypothetical protein